MKDCLHEHEQRTRSREIAQKISEIARRKGLQLKADEISRIEHAVATAVKVGERLDDAVEAALPHLQGTWDTSENKSKVSHSSLNTTAAMPHSPLAWHR